MDNSINLTVSSQVGATGGRPSLCDEKGDRRSPLLAGIYIAIIMILLSSCASHVRKSDGPPNFYVDETKVKNAVPKVEATSKFGNMPSYQVFGKRYYTLKSSKNYDEVGIASWYGTQFHAKRTSSGEPYNMLAMTAAHKTLPLPTYVEVTNLKNNKTIVVKVNDRGPFAEKRIIDLSYVAAKKLGMIGHGTTQVRVKAIDPRTYGKPIVIARQPIKFQHNQSKPFNLAKHYPKKGATSSPSSPPVFLQVGAFRNKSYAIKLQRQLTAMLNTPVRIVKPTKKSGLYRVHVGPITDVATANKLSNRLKSAGISSNKVYSA